MRFWSWPAPHGSVARWRFHPRRLIEISDPADQQRDRLAFGFGEIGVPGIHNHHRAHLVALVPGFVLERIVEGDAATLLPRVLDAAHTDRAIRSEERRVGKGWRAR